MCGIVGFTGAQDALPVLLSGLKKLEYRGYDSAGIAFFNQDHIRVIKAKGRLSVLEQKVAETPDLDTVCGIGHTRWATHGEPTNLNSHPHLSNNGRIAVVHNGIIENYASIKEKLIRHGYRFVSDTDTEVIAHLLDYYYQGDIVEATQKVTLTVKGSYALGVLCAENPGEIIAARHDSPLVIGLGDGANYIASDIPAILEYTRDYLLLEDEEIARLRPDGVSVYNLDGEIVEKKSFTVDWDIAAAEKGGYEHFMLKEIFEQPKAVRDTVGPRLTGGRIDFSEAGLTDAFLKGIRRIHIIACGSAAHAGVVGKYILEKLARIPVEWDLASEFRYRQPILTPQDLCIIISQSGETADTLAALREAKRQQIPVLAIVNVVGSTIAREADYVLYTWAGPEIAVATTKAYSTQLTLLYLLAVKLAALCGGIDSARALGFIRSIETLDSCILQMLEKQPTLQYFASLFHNLKDIFFIGRGVDYAVALEGSLKLKEISYIRSEAYAAGELKHGTIALVRSDSLIIALATQRELLEKMVSNIKEVKAREGKILAIVQEKDASAMEGIADYILSLPDCEELFTPSLSVVALQMLAYYIAVERGCDVDKPRNLAKSVTVE